MNFNFQITFYMCQNPSNVVNKSLTTFKVASGYMVEASSIQNPVVLVEHNNLVISQCNYCFIPIFSRYYFIENVEFVGNNLFRFSLKVDVLKSFANNILSGTAFVKRTSADDSNAYKLIDPEINFQSVISPEYVYPTSQKTATFDDDGIAGAYYNYIVVLKAGTVFNTDTETLSVLLGADAFSPSYPQLDSVKSYQADASGVASQTYGSKYLVCRSIYGANLITQKAAQIGHESDILGVYKVPFSMYTTGARLFTYAASQIVFLDEKIIDLNPTQSLTGANWSYMVNGACQYIRWCYYPLTHANGFYPHEKDAIGTTLNAKTKYILNIPFAQEIEINYADIKDWSYLHIYYSLDIYNGESKYYVIVANEILGSPVTSNKDGVVIASGSANMIQQVPVSTIETYNYLYQKGNLKLNTEMSQITHAMGIMGVASNPMQISNAVLGIANQGIGYHFTRVNNEREMNHLTASAKVSSSSSIIAYNLNYSYVKRFDAIPTSANNLFIQKRGYIYDAIDTLSNQINEIVSGTNYAYDYGYIEASDLYFSSTATKSEKIEIENLFNAGVYYLHET